MNLNKFYGMGLKGFCFIQITLQFGRHAHTALSGVAQLVGCCPQVKGRV